MELLISIGLVGFFYGLVRKWMNPVKMPFKFLYDLLTCDFCTIFWVSWFVVPAFGIWYLPFITSGYLILWRLVNSN